MTEGNPAALGLRERKKQATRAALVAAAVRLAAEHGAEHVTVDAISEAAGVSARTFFNYFDARDDVFVMIGAESSARVRQAVRAAPSEVSALTALRDAMAAELAEVEQQQELWRLHSEVLRRSPHLLARSIGAHMADELALAETLAERIGAGSPLFSGERAECASPDDERRRRALDLYPRLLAAVGVAAVRVAVEHWCVRQDEAAFTDVFRETFEHLAAGLPAPPPADQ
ncbi:TetR/AcrR family transcriptional regulator [Streptomyces hawaiiensis]|jgi:AcrR family transcriptional regulator|uniref:TetR family transcriptional regulator n=1 Tax=Streptomyces hawaiiensis TaxID=67305 RepID=A0A6G5R8A9_9ACTN|nr:TetR family transcriptional regulator [Streptomyces hawaiiensis]QCD54124.1 TetR family transcriptional regulator [Streptomyces hawaiiensis]